MTRYVLMHAMIIKFHRVKDENSNIKGNKGCTGISHVSVSKLYRLTEQQEQYITEIDPSAHNIRAKQNVKLN